MARPRGFEPDDALDALMELFWERGYDSTSMQDVEAATGLKKQSLYRLFGNKRRMYLKTLNRYDETVLEQSLAVLSKTGDAQQRIGRFFDAGIDMAINRRDRRGCFVCNASVDRVQNDLDTQAAVAAMTGKLRAALEDALAASEPYRSGPERRRSMAALLLAVHFGIRVMVRAGLPEAALREAAAEAVAAV